jgi:hypothetical protein
MAQRIFNNEQYEAVLIRGGLDGGPVPVTFASGVTISGVTIGAEVEIANDSGNPVPVNGEVEVERLQGTQAFSIVPNNSVDLSSITSALYVGYTGNVNIVLSGDTTPVLFANVPGGSTLPFQVKRVYATSTTASGIVGIV